MYFEQLREHLFANVDYPESMREVMGKITAWHQFCALPSETKMLFTYPDDQGVWDAGYKNRRKAEGREDKEYMHFHGNYRDLLQKYGLAELVEKDPTLKAMWDLVSGIRTEAGKLITVIATDLDQHIPGLAKNVADSTDLMTLRFLHYTPEDDQDDNLAAAHFDRSGFTLHLYENKNGLQHLTLAHQWEDSPIDSNNTVVFAGYQLQAESRGEIKNTWHRVIRKHDTQVQGDRYSLVAFVPFKHTPTYDASARSQDLKPGYQN